MSQTPSIMFSNQLLTNKPPIPTRNSDDYYPAVDAAHPWHIFCNAHNALLTKYLNIIPDWDMFQTLHPWASFHAAARCLSGGPISVTDQPGRHDIDLVRQFTAPATDGNTILLRPSVVGRSVDVYNSYHNNSLCRIAAYDGDAVRGVSFIGFFNCKDWRLVEFVSMEPFIGCDDGTWVVRGYKSRHISGVLYPHRFPSRVFGIIAVEQRSWEVFATMSTLDMVTAG